MPIRDPGPIYNLGFGVTSRQHLRYNEGENREGINPESGLIAKALSDHPITRFFATSAATMVGMAVGGRFIKKGGVKLAQRLQASNAPWTNNLIKDFRKVQEQMDAWQGVTRTLADPDDPTVLFMRAADGRMYGDHTEELKGFFFTKAERERAARTGQEPVAEWTIKQEIQQSLVRQARRLPYELPAAYMVQAGAINNLLQEHDEARSQVNWKNPIDVITNFVTESVKSTAFMVTPFEVGAAGGRHGWRRLMTYGDDKVNLTPGQKDIKNASVSLRAILGQVGADATDLLNKTVQYSSQVSGSFSAGVNAARENSIDLVSFLHKMRHGELSYSNELDVQRLNKAQRILRSQEFFDLGPGPFRGAFSGIKKAREEWDLIAQSNKAFEESMLYGRDVFERTNAHRPDRIAALYRALGRGAHPIEELGGRVHDLGKGGPLSGGKWREGKFYQGQIQNEYMKLLSRELHRLGVDEKAADRFSRLAKIKPLHESGAAQNMNRRMHLHGADPLMGVTDDEAFDAVVKQLGMFDRETRQSLRNQLPVAIRSVDDLFGNTRFRDLLNRKIGDQWNFFERKVLPQFGEEMLSTRRMAYESFTGNITQAQKQFLARKTAQMSGLRMVDDVGEAVSDQVVHNRLHQIGFDPANFDQMRAYLTTKGVISKPWTVEGRNVFGIRAVTVADALNKGYFRQGPGTEHEISRLTARMAFHDPISPLGQYKLGGMYETASGRIIDFSSIKRSATRFTDVLSREFHVPLIKLNPLNLLGYSAKAEAREKSVLQYLPSMSHQPFMVGSKHTDDFYMWMRKGGRSNKGRVFAFSGDKYHELDGLYSAQSSVGGWHARFARLAMGEMGMRPSANDAADIVEEGRFQNIKKIFNVWDNQPDSFGGYLSRFLNRKSDLNNPLTFSRLLAEGQITTRKGNVRLADLGEEELVRSFNNFSSQIRRFGFSPKVLKILESVDDQRFKDLTTYNFRGRRVPNTFTLGQGGIVNIAELKTPAQISEAIELMLNKDRNSFRTLPRDVRASMRRAQESLLQRHIDEASGPSYWDKQLPQSARSTTVHTRLDKAKQDMYKYLALRSSVTRRQDFQEFVPELLDRLQIQRSKGLLSQAEFTEARAAILSMQIEHQTFATYRLGLSNVEHGMSTVQALLSGGSGTDSAKSILRDFASGKVGVSEGRYGLIQPALRRRFGIAPYEYKGTSYNPFGSNTVMVPTFGTVWGRDSMQAILSAAGVNTWSNPAAYSSASIPISHMFERLNRFFGPSGLMLNPERYRGPLDFYGRGVIGQRVLPAVAGATAFMTVDRTIGGYVNERDQNGNRVYSPFFIGLGADAVARGQIGLAAAIPGGMTGDEKREELFEGEVAIRAGRWWPLGNTPFRGGRINYYRPSWYRRLKAGALYQDQTFGTPIERALFGYDFSPLRPLDPYRFERQHYEDRPYPVTGEYFTGPWGPLTTALNMTVGKVLKPQFRMHKDEVAVGLSQYQPVGEYGAYLPTEIGYGAEGFGGGPVGLVSGTGPGSGGAQADISAQNTQLAILGQAPLSTASYITTNTLASHNQQYRNAAMGIYGTPAGPGFDPRIIPGVSPIQPSDLSFQAGRLGYEVQELFGIYGFAFGSMRSMLGLGNQDFATNKPVLESSGNAYGASRSFWDLNLGGLGDAPLPIEGSLSNIEFSEIIRRFVPRQPSGIEAINPIPNTMGEKAPWLPGSDYFINFHLGDPYTKIQEGELRLPGEGYERLHELHPDATGQYGMVDQHKILGDVAPWSNQYRMIDSAIGSGFDLSPEQRDIVETTRQQVEAKSRRHEFTPYRYKYMSLEDISSSPIDWALGRMIEKVSHADTYFNTKFLPTRTAQEDWERQNVYGSTFPQWQHPIRDFVKPLAYKSTQRDPISSATVMGSVGALFGSTPRARLFGSVVGGAIGAVSSMAGNVYHLITGERYIPKDRRRQIALEEYTDILTYVKNMHLYNQAMMSGQTEAAESYRRAAQTTMYGADVYNAPLEQLAMAIPKRKREHFRAMAAAPEEERESILSTAGRLERRLLQGVWGMDVEKRPDLNDYFQDHELPGVDWEGWHPNTNMEHVKIKMAQSLGIELSEMGYYPQQIREANLVNPSYPDFNLHGARRSTQQQIRQLLHAEGISGDVYPVYTPYPGTRLELQSGVFS